MARLTTNKRRFGNITEIKEDLKNYSILNNLNISYIDIINLFNDNLYLKTHIRDQKKVTRMIALKDKDIDYIGYSTNIKGTISSNNLQNDIYIEFREIEKPKNLYLIIHFLKDKEINLHRIKQNNITKSLIYKIKNINSILELIDGYEKTTTIRTSDNSYTIKQKIREDKKTIIDKNNNHYIADVTTLKEFYKLIKEIES